MAEVGFSSDDPSRIQEHLFEEGFKNVELVESRCSGLADKLISLAE